MMNDEWVLIRNCNWLHEADMIKSILEGSGIEVFLPDEHILNIQPHYANVIGGARVLVRSSDFDRARLILETEVSGGSEHPGDDETD